MAPVFLKELHVPLLAAALPWPGSGVDFGLCLTRRLKGHRAEHLNHFFQFGPFSFPSLSPLRQLPYDPPWAVERGRHSPQLQEGTREARAELFVVRSLLLLFYL